MFIKPRYLPILEKYSSLHAVTKEELYESILEFKNDELVSRYIDRTDFQECLLNCLCILADKRRIIGREAAVLVDCLFDYYWSIENIRDKITILNKMYDILSIDEIETEEQKQKLLLLQNAISRIYIVDSEGVIHHCTKHI